MLCTRVSFVVIFCCCQQKHRVGGDNTTKSTRSIYSRHSTRQHTTHSYKFERTNDAHALHECIIRYTLSFDRWPYAYCNSNNVKSQNGTQSSMNEEWWWWKNNKTNNKQTNPNPKNDLIYALFCVRKPKSAGAYTAPTCTMCTECTCSSMS